VRTLAQASVPSLSRLSKVNEEPPDRRDPVIDDDDMSDEEVYEYAPGEAETAGAVTLPNEVVAGPSEIVDADGTRHPVREDSDTRERSAWTGYGPKIDPTR
jgi:hypothetical protein